MKPRQIILILALFAALALNTNADTRYVNANNPSPSPPYTSWLTAATNIQDAVDAAVAGDLVLVTNGVYATGGRAVYGTLTNRVAVDRAIRLESVMGPEVTVIEGYQVPTNRVGDGAIRCVYLTNGAWLAGFTLRNGATRTNGHFLYEDTGGGLLCWPKGAVASNCIITGNFSGYGGGGVSYGILKRSLISSNTLVRFRGGGGGVYFGELDGCVIADNKSLISQGGGVSASSLVNCLITGNEAGGGGGASGSMLTNCVIMGNSAVGEAGGADFSSLNNCTVIGNTANTQGGVARGSLDNCIVYFNSATSNANFGDGNITVRFTCTFPLPAGGAGNITNVPLFLDTNGWANLRLQSNSPCINAGNNSYVTTGTDLDGIPRISGDTVDMGAYEFRSPASVLSYAWAQQCGLPTDGSEDFTDSDGDGANNWQEWRADTSPTNASSALLMRTTSNSVTGLMVSWASVATRSYRLERRPDLGAATPFQTIATNIPGVAGTKTYSDVSATNGGPYFYRVGVE